MGCSRRPRRRSSAARTYSVEERKELYVLRALVRDIGVLVADCFCSNGVLCHLTRIVCMIHRVYRTRGITTIGYAGYDVSPLSCRKRQLRTRRVARQNRGCIDVRREGSSRLLSSHCCDRVMTWMHNISHSEGVVVAGLRSIEYRSTSNKELVLESSLYSTVLYSSSWQPEDTWLGGVGRVSHTPLPQMQ